MTNSNIKATYIFFFFFFIYLLTFSTGYFDNYFYSADGKIEYEQTVVIARGNWGLLWSPVKYIGMSVVQIPFYFAGEILSKILAFPLNPTFALLMNPVVTALGCLLVYLIVSLWSNQKTALAVAVLYGLTTLAWPYAKQDYSEPLLATCLLGSFWALVKYKITGQNKWFFFSLVFMFFLYLVKPLDQIFIFSWLIYLFLIEKERKTPFKAVFLKFSCLLIVWAILLPINYNIILAMAGGNKLDWFNNSFHKIVVRHLSPFDSPFIHSPLIVIGLLAIFNFARRLKNEFILIISLVILYAAVIHFTEAFFCIHDFGARYYVSILPFLIILSFPIIEQFDNYPKYFKFIFLVLAVFGFWVQIFVNSIDVNYYGNLIGGCLGWDWKKYIFSWRFSPLGVYPNLMARFITGLEIPIKGISNVSASIVPFYRLDYIWTKHPDNFIKIGMVLLFLSIIYLGYTLFKKSGLLFSLQKYFKIIFIINFCFLIIFILAFVPKEIIRPKKYMSVNIKNPGFEEFMSGWIFVDFYNQKGQSPMSFSSNSVNFAEGGKSLEAVLRQENIAVSLASSTFEVKKNQIIRASCLVNRTDKLLISPVSLRIVFRNPRDEIIYYSGVTSVKRINNSWEKITSKVLVPEGAVEASLWINVWGVTEKNSKIWFDDIQILQSN